MDSKAKREMLLFVLFVLTGSLFSFIYLKPFLGFKDTLLLRLDWHQQFQFTGAAWISMSKYGEFPFWNPYINGGNFLFAHPQSQVISPQALIVSIFGPIKGIYYSVLFFYILGFVGCYFVGRYFKLSYLATLYLAVLFAFQSHVMNYLFLGNTLWTTAGYLPLAFYFFLKSRDDWRYGVAAGFFHALMYLGGGIYIFMLYAVFIAIFTLSEIAVKKDIKLAKSLAILFLFSFLFASIKILPNLDLYEINKRKVGFEILPLKPEVLYKTFLDKNQAWDILSVHSVDGYSFHWPHFGDYIGIIPVILALIGIVLWYKNLELLLATIGVFLLYMSNYSYFSFIWKWMHSVPPFTSLQHPARFVIFLVLMLGIFGAKVVSKLSRIKINNIWINHLKNLTILILILFVFADLTRSSYIIISNFKPIQPMQEKLIKWDDKFEYYDFYERFNLSDKEVENLDANYFKSFAHVDTLSNKGTKNRGLDPMSISGNTRVSSKGEPGYKGEYYFKEPNAGSISLEKWSPNKVTLNVKAEKESILVINQNFHKHWKTKEKFEIVNLDGLLGIKIPKGEHEVNLYVFQNKILIGLLLSLVGIILGAYLLIKVIRAEN